jgi:hypothetical protein
MLLLFETAPKTSVSLPYTLAVARNLLLGLTAFGMLD